MSCWSLTGVPELFARAAEGFERFATILPETTESLDGTHFVQSPSNRRGQDASTAYTAQHFPATIHPSRPGDKSWRKHVKPPPDNARFNYLTDIVPRWHGSTLFLVSVYACPGPNAISPTFEDRFARLKPAGGGRFDLDFMRHTGQWVPLHQGLTVEQCLVAIRDDPWFMP